MHCLPLSHFRSRGQDRPWLLPSSELSSVPGGTLSSRSAVYQDAGKGLCSGTGRMKLVYGDMCAPPFSCQTLETTVPTETRICQGVSGWRKEKAEAWCRSEVDLGAQKEVSHSSDDLSPWGVDVRMGRTTPWPGPLGSAHLFPSIQT